MSSGAGALVAIARSKMVDASAALRGSASRASGAPRTDPGSRTDMALARDQARPSYSVASRPATALGGAGDGPLGEGGGRGRGQLLKPRRTRPQYWPPVVRRASSDEPNAELMGVFTDNLAITCRRPLHGAACLPRINRSFTTPLGEDGRRASSAGENATRNLAATAGGVTWRNRTSSIADCWSVGRWITSGCPAAPG